MRNLVLAVHGSAVPDADATGGRLAVRRLPRTGLATEALPHAGPAVERLPHAGPATERLPHAGPAVERLAEAVRRLTGAPVAVGHLDHRTPSLPDVLADRPGAVVVPLLLGDGYHRTVDIPAVARHFDCVVTRGLSGEHAVALALHDRLRAAERAAGGPADAVVVAGAGSSRPGGNDGTLTAVRQLGALLPVPVTAAYCSASAPGPAEAVARLHARGFRRVALATHLLAPGRFTRALAPVPGVWAVGEPLADHPRLAGLVAARYAGAAPAGRGARAA
ncbi:sirohydrochlorin chelatase [Streptomyces gardneri]|uniref:sirohydrochlorin chelatase n=1 Tax=Streptomyces gardneri TaxID=66892 RepID=UPI00369B94C4